VPVSEEGGGFCVRVAHPELCGGALACESRSLAPRAQFLRHVLYEARDLRFGVEADAVGEVDRDGFAIGGGLEAHQTRVQPSRCQEDVRAHLDAQ